MTSGYANPVVSEYWHWRGIERGPRPSRDGWRLHGAVRTALRHQ